MNMTMMLSIASLFYMVILAILFFTKSNMKNKETRIFSILIELIIFGILLELSLRIIAPYMNDYPLLNDFLAKLFLVYTLVWFVLITIYNYLISFEYEKYYMFKCIMFVSTTIFGMILLLLPIEYFIPDGANYYSYTFGQSVNLLYLLIVILMVMNVVFMVFNYKKVLSSKKYHPIIFSIILFIISALIQNKFPDILLNTFVQALATFIMYNTIENPDVMLIEELNVAKDLAEKANNAKSEFLSSMSHEIRTPLNAIDGFAQLIMEEESMHIIKDEAKDIISASQNLIEIVNGILDISKIEADKLEIVDAIYEPTKIFDELEKLTIARIGDKPIELKTKIAKDLPEYLNGDYVRVKQIVLNLLTNAAKYTREGRIDFNVECVKKNNVCRLIISVKDTGIGIKKENLDAIFNKFERMDLDKNMTIEGTGLGLAITKRLVELMKGKIVVDSVYGKGSTFTVSIDQRIANPRIIKEEEKKDSKEPKLNVKGKKVLIVDDNAINLKVAERLLLQYKVETTTATSGVECLDKVDNNAYDIILMDDMMPKMSGTETLNELKKRPHFKTPVIALTANAIVGMKEKYLNAGFDDYLSKPIDKQELERVLKTYLMK